MGYSVDPHWHVKLSQGGFFRSCEFLVYAKDEASILRFLAKPTRGLEDIIHAARSDVLCYFCTLSDCRPRPWTLDIPVGWRCLGLDVLDEGLP